VLAEFSETQRSQALDRFGLLRPFLEDGVPLAGVARQHKLPLRTLERWLHRYRQRGLAGLVRKPRIGRGQYQLPEELQQCIEGLALRRPRLSAAAIHREVIEVAKAHGWLAPSYSTVFSIVRELAPDLVIVEPGRRTILNAMARDGRHWQPAKITA
jgi:putative transposase